MSEPTLSGVYVGKAKDWKPTPTDAERFEHIQHFIDRSAPLPADEAAWLLQIANAAIEERNQYRDILNGLRDDLSDIIAIRKETI